MKQLDIVQSETVVTHQCLGDCSICVRSLPKKTNDLSVLGTRHIRWKLQVQSHQLAASHTSARLSKQISVIWQSRRFHVRPLTRSALIQHVGSQAALLISARLLVTLPTLMGTYICSNPGKTIVSPNVNFVILHTHPMDCKLRLNGSASIM